jgi:signal peptidase I
MARRSRGSLGRLAATGLTAAAAVALWLVIAPAGLGGQFNYAVVTGVSMEPLLHHGDLVLLRPRGGYTVGEVVAYHNAELGRVVLHRIVGRSGPYYIFKGDNNSYVDPDRPTRSQLIGQLWLTVPLAGGVLNWLHTPRDAALTAGIAALLVLGGAVTVRRRGPAGRVRAIAGSGGAAKSPHGGYAAARPLAAAGAALAAVSGLAAAVASGHASTTSTPVLGLYSEQGSYSATARVRPDVLYPGGHVATGQTMFVSLVPVARLGFAYRFVSAAPHTVSGVARLHLSLTSGLGWSRTLPTPAERAFRGDRVGLAAPVNLLALEQTLRRYLELSGEPNDTFTVTATPEVSVHGRVAGTPFADTFAPSPLAFTLDARSFRLQAPTLGSSTPGVAPGNPLQPSSPGVITRERAATLAMLGLRPHVTAVRRVAVAGLILGLILLLAAAPFAARRPADELGELLRRYGDVLVPVSTPPAQPAAGYTEVADLDGLVRLARGLDRPILHEQDGQRHVFYVEDRSTYRYELAADGAAARAPDDALTLGFRPDGMLQATPARSPAPAVAGDRIPHLNGSAAS